MLPTDKILKGNVPCLDETYPINSRLSDERSKLVGGRSAFIGRLHDALLFCSAVFDINLDVVWETVQTALPDLLKILPTVRQNAISEHSNDDGMEP